MFGNVVTGSKAPHRRVERTGEYGSSLAALYTGAGMLWQALQAFIVINCKAHQPGRMSLMQMSYWRFAAMIATSTIVMYGLMYLNTYSFEHIFWSETRAWMALVMGATMSVIMLGYMLGMYRNRTINLVIFGGSIAMFAFALWIVRSQATVDDVDYMRAMIPHHSIAILTSERAQITDPRVRKLADEIIEAQEREIAEMKSLAADLEARE
ncbi:DUF305 domain-containing protein [Skermanella rosea]|nr:MULTISPECIES: DUF305 domain-containing protein [Skermanella]UEM03665.1 DUF305 domain-containing protein [Skermanella rosea]